MFRARAMSSVTIIFLLATISLTCGQLVIPRRTNLYQNDQVVPITNTRYDGQQEPPVVYGTPVVTNTNTNRQTVLTVSAVPRTRPIVPVSREVDTNEVTSLRVVPIARPVVAPRARPVAPPVYSYDPPASQGGPYSFKYSADHGDGTTSNREESSDGSGTVKGSYSYIDSDGLYRQVDYIADESGYRATIRTNEPGTERAGNQITDPAGTVWEIEPPPPAVVARYANVDRLSGRRGSTYGSVGTRRRTNVFAAQPVDVDTVYDGRNVGPPIGGDPRVVGRGAVGTLVPRQGGYY